MSQHYVGVILPNGIYKMLMDGKNNQINVVAYQEAGEKYNLIPVFTRVKNIVPGDKNIKGFIKNGSSFELKSIALPPVMYCRSFLNKRQMKFLNEERIIFYNTKGISHNKFKMHQIIAENEELQSFLPHTEIANEKNLNKMMKKFSRLIMKPAKGSLGGGIMKLEKVANNYWELHYPVARKQWEFLKFDEEHIPSVLAKSLKKKHYIIQEQIDLATYKECKFDLRVVVQRNYTGDWCVAGILCKVAPNKERFVTNISQGGNSLSFDKVFKGHPYLPYESVRNELHTISLKIAKHLEKYTEHIADVALDMAVDKNGHLYFIESNFRGRYGNVRYKGKRLKEWKAKHENPIGYARFLLDNRK